MAQTRTPSLLHSGWLYTSQQLLTKAFLVQKVPQQQEPTVALAASQILLTAGLNKPILIASNKGKFFPLRGCPHRRDAVSQAQSWDTHIRKLNHVFAADSFPPGCLAAMHTDACVEGLHLPPVGYPTPNTELEGFGACLYVQEESCRPKH